MSARHRHAKERARFWQWAIPNLGECLRIAGMLAEAGRRALPDGADLAEALDRLHRCIVHDARDWGRAKRDALTFAIVIGWDDAWRDVATMHGWSDTDVSDLKRFHAAVNAHKGIHREGHP